MISPYYLIKGIRTGIVSEPILPSYEFAHIEAASGQFYRAAPKVHLKSDKTT
jgi:hypothetical protein